MERQCLPYKTTATGEPKGQRCARRGHLRRPLRGVTREPSPEGRIGCKELKTRTPGRGDTSPRDPASPAEEGQASGATGAVMHSTGGWQVPA